MPQWLIIAISIFWCVWLLNEVHSVWEYSSLTPRQQKTVTFSMFAKTSFITFIPFTIFWWSWIIWG